MGFFLFVFVQVIDNSFQGRIVNLGISCQSDRYKNKNACLLFKQEGNLTCKFSFFFGGMITAGTLCGEELIVFLWTRGGAEVTHWLWV